MEQIRWILIEINLGMEGSCDGFVVDVVQSSCVAPKMVHDDPLLLNTSPSSPTNHERHNKTLSRFL